MTALSPARPPSRTVATTVAASADVPHPRTILFGITLETRWDWLPVGIFAVALIAGMLAMIFIPDQQLLIAVLIPVGVVLGLTMLVRPELVLLLSVFYTPFESDQFRPLPLPDSLSVSKLIGFLVLGVFFFHVLLRGRKFRLLDDPQDFTLLIFATMILLSGVVSAFPGKTLESTSRLLRMFVYYFAVKNLLTSERVLWGLMWTMVISGAIAGTIGISIYIEENATRIHDTRVGGVYMDPNDYAVLANMVLIIGIHLFEATRSRGGKMLLIACAIPLIGSLITAASRGGTIALVLALAVYLWRHPRRNQLVLGIIVFIALAFPMLPESVRDRFTGGGSDALSSDVLAQTTEFSTERRTAYQVFGIQLVSQNPVLGYGYGTFAWLYPESEFALQDNPLTPSDRFRLAHNAYTEIAVGTGLLGLLAYIGVQLVSLFYLNRAWNYSARGSVRWAAASGFELALLSMMVGSFFLSIEHFNYLWISVAVSSAVMLQLRQAQGQLAGTPQAVPEVIPARSAGHS